MNIQDVFVTTVEIRNGKEVPQKVFVDDYQITEESARNAKLANTLSESPHG